MRRPGSTASAMALGAGFTLVLLVPQCNAACPPGTAERHEQCLSESPRGAGGDAATATNGGSASPGGTGGRNSRAGQNGDGGQDASDGSGGTEPQGAGGVASGGASNAPGGGSGAMDGSPDALVCPPGRVASEIGCIAEKIFVDARLGNDDDNPGSAGRPLQSFRAAMRKARPNQWVVFEPGVYGADTHDDFADPIPSGVTVSKEARQGEVIFDGAGTASLSLEGSAKLSGVTVRNFFRAFDVASGSPEISGVVFEKALLGARLRGNAHVRCWVCTFVDTPSVGLQSTVLVEGSAQLRLEAVHVKTITGAVSNAIRLLDSATLVLDGGNFEGLIGPSVTAYGGVSVDLKRVRFDGNALVDVAIGDKLGAPVRNLEMADVTCTGAVHLLGRIESVVVRRSRFVNVLIDGTHRNDDFGHAGVRGDNTFSSQGAWPYLLGVRGVDNAITAAGNFWPPGVQASTDQGEYPPGTTFTDADGPNVSVVGTVDGGAANNRVDL